MLLSQSLKSSADVVELIDFVQNRLKRHWVYLSRLENLRWENFRWTGLRSEDLKEEKVVTTPFVIVSVLIVENNVAEMIGTTRSRVSFFMKSTARPPPEFDCLSSDPPIVMPARQATIRQEYQCIKMQCFCKGTEYGSNNFHQGPEI
jgi:hypothetical protein